MIIAEVKYCVGGTNAPLDWKKQGSKVTAKK